MIRNSAKLTALAAVALLGGAVVTSCSKTTNPTDTGTAKLALIIDGATVSSVAYTVLSGATPPATLASGTINVSDPNATLSLDITLPPGTGDVVKLTATTSTGLPCVGTSTPFNVVAGQSTSVTLSLVCGGGGVSMNGVGVNISATIVQGDNCPSIVSSAASPAQTSVGGTISVSALATDPDTSLTPPDVLTYAWSPAANFASPTSASTTFSCTTDGVQTLTLTVNDSHVPTPCQTSITMTVKCIKVSVCGNGVVEPGEQCEPPGTPTCSATCQSIMQAVCGDNIITAPETCEPPNTATCNATCQTRTASCGDGFITAPETCEPPNTATCSATCQSIAPPDPCATCQLAGSTSTPKKCFNTSAPGGGTNLANFGCNSLTGASKTACLALLSCLQGATCQAAIHSATADFGESGANFDDPTPCLCGTATDDACLAASSWNGVCAPQYVAAATADGVSVLGAFFQSTSGVGISNNLMTCDIDDANCTSVCIGH